MNDLFWGSCFEEKEKLHYDFRNIFFCYSLVAFFLQMLKPEHANYDLITYTLASKNGRGGGHSSGGGCGGGNTHEATVRTF